MQLKVVPRKISGGGDSRLELWVGIIYYLGLVGWCIKGQRSGGRFRKRAQSVGNRRGPAAQAKG